MDFRPRRPDEGRLSGSWLASPQTWELQRVGADADLDDSQWQPIEVPGHWGQVPALAESDGPILHRRRFDHRPPEQKERLWLRFDGVMSRSEVWLNGHYIGDTGGYFASQRFEVGSHLARPGEHLLAVEVACPAPGNRRDKTSLTGSLQAGRLAPVGNPGGIWRDVWVDSTGPVAILHSRLLVTQAATDRATVSIRLVLDAAEATRIRIDTSLLGPDGQSAGGGAVAHNLASGENRIEWSVEVDNPILWWPAALGEQPLYEVAVAVRLADGELSDRRDWRTGLRRISVDNSIWRVNGRRLFIKGIAAGPHRRFLNQTPADVIRGDVRAVSEAGLDLIRVYGHVARPELYEEANRLGLLIWQDLPLVGGYSSKVGPAARSLARATVDHLGHHPSVGLWCGHCEPNGQALPEPALGSVLRRRHRPASSSGHNDQPSGADGRPSYRSDADRDQSPDELRSTLRFGTRLGRHLLPSWNRSVLDPVVSRELRNADPSRPVIARSGSLPGPMDRIGSDTSLWLGWRVGLVENLAGLLRLWPRLGTFLSDIGTQSVSIADWDADEPTWPNAERGSFARYVPRTAYGDGRSWAAATRVYQSDVLRFHIESIRRLKYRPAAGFCVTALADVDPSGGYGVLDVDRRPKPAHDVLVDACRPVVIVADPPPPVVVPGETVALAVHAINDLPTAIPHATVTATATASGSGWRHTITWEGALAADSCRRVGDLRFDAPSDPQRIEIDLELRSADQSASNRYTTVVIPSSEALS